MTAWGLTIAIVLLLETALGLVWGQILSRYASVYVSQGYTSGSYGALLLLASVASVASIAVAGRLYDRGLGRAVSASGGLALASSVAMLSAGSPLASILIGVAGGFLAVTAGYVSSGLSRGDYRVFAAVYASSLAGVSLGSLLVAVGAVVEPGVLAVVALLCGIAYSAMPGVFSEKRPARALVRVEEPAGSLGFLYVSLIVLGFAYGIVDTIDYHVYSMSGDVGAVAVVLAASSLASSIASAFMAASVRSSARAHVAGVALQSAATVLLALGAGSLMVVALYAIRRAALVVSDSSLDGMISAASPAEKRASSLSTAYAVTDLAGGLGKLAGATLTHYFSTALAVSATLMAAYALTAWFWAFCMRELAGARSAETLASIARSLRRYLRLRASASGATREHALPPVLISIPAQTRPAV